MTCAERLCAIPALYIGSFVRRFEGWTEAESAPLLKYLTEHATQPDHIYTHTWEEGDVLMWDNRCVMHYAVHDYDHTKEDEMRIMNRVCWYDGLAPKSVNGIAPALLPGAAVERAAL